MNRRNFISGVLSTFLLSHRTQIVALEHRNALSKFNKTGYISSPIFLQHHIDPRHPESPERMKYIHRAMGDSGLLPRLSSLDFNKNPGIWIKAVHSLNHIASIKNNSPVAHRVAIAGVGACLSAVEQVAAGSLNNVFCAIRPPGHHALNTGREEGFCYYNNVAIAARYAQQQYGLKKILIIDWDYHHGNATEAMFYDDPSVLYFSTHDQFAYPGTGDPAKKGSGKGTGYNINIHLPCGTNDKDIIDVFESVLIPAAFAFQPDMILISAGFDSRKDDLLGCFNITDKGFSRLTTLALQIAYEFCNGRLVSILEGGYNLNGNASAVVTHISTLLDT